jgi:hypothetical protein
LITAIATLGYFIAKENPQFYWILFPVFLSLLFFVSAIAIGMRLFRANFHYVDPMIIVNEYREREKSFRFFLNKCASTICDTVNDNAGVVNSKEKGLRLMYSLIILGLAIFALSFLFLAINLLL